MPPAVVFRAEVEMTTRTEIAVGPLIVATSTTSRFAAEVAIYAPPPPPMIFIEPFTIRPCPTGDQLDNLPNFDDDPFGETTEAEDLPNGADRERWGINIHSGAIHSPHDTETLAALIGARLAAADQVEAAAAVAMDVDRGAPQKRGVFGPRFDLLGSPSYEAPAIIMRGGRSA